MVIVGINTPEFAFEHNPANVQAAVMKFGINYPVALDNNDDTWNAYNNDSWPADYLIDKSKETFAMSVLVRAITTKPKRQSRIWDSALTPR